MAKQKTIRKSWNTMNADELATATRQFDGEIRFEDTKHLTPKQRASFESWRRGGAAKRKRQITVKIDSATLLRCEAYAQKHAISLSGVINRGLASVFTFAD